MLNCRPEGWYVDCTLGGGGHAGPILEKLGPGGRLIGIDRDRAAVDWCRKRFAGRIDQVTIVHGNYSQLADILDSLSVSHVDGILADLGMSQFQIQGSGRGFSFTRDEPLDMRMDTSSSLTAQEVVNGADERTLTGIFRDYGEERWSGRIAREIVKRRKSGAILTSLALAEIVKAAVPKKSGSSSRKKRTTADIHPATRVFMAMRIFVNQELAHLERFLETAPRRLSGNGRLCVLSFHSLEDRMVKHAFKSLSRTCTCPPEAPICTCARKQEFINLTRKVMRPRSEEIAANPMARSTRLRAVHRVGEDSIIMERAAGANALHGSGIKNDMA